MQCLRHRGMHADQAHHLLFMTRLVSVITASGCLFCLQEQGTLWLQAQSHACLHTSCLRLLDILVAKTCIVNDFCQVTIKLFTHAGGCGLELPRSRPCTLTLAASAWRAHQRHPLFFVTATGEGAVRSGGADGSILQHRITADHASQWQQLTDDAAMHDACSVDAAADGLPGLSAGSNPALSPKQGPRQDPGGCTGAAARGLPGPTASEPAEKPGRMAFTQLRRRQRCKPLDWDAAARKPRASQGLQARAPAHACSAATLPVTSVATIAMVLCAALVCKANWFQWVYCVVCCAWCCASQSNCDCVSHTAPHAVSFIRKQRR